MKSSKINDLFPRSLKLPEFLIPVLQKPLGNFFKANSDELAPEKRVINYLSSKQGLVFVVGDFVSQSLLQEGFIPDLIIIDEMTQRNAYKVNLPEKKEILEVTNKPGEISKSAWELLRILCLTVFSKSDSISNSSAILKVVKVDGEEDLLVLPLALDAPLGTVILYGFPPMLTGEHGIILLEITDDIKRVIGSILEKFEPV